MKMELSSILILHFEVIAMHNLISSLTCRWPKQATAKSAQRQNFRILIILSNSIFSANQNEKKCHNWNFILPEDHKQKHLPSKCVINLLPIFGIAETFRCIIFGAVYAIRINIVAWTT